jgi:hypothetical protein
MGTVPTHRVAVNRMSPRHSTRPSRPTWRVRLALAYASALLRVYGRETLAAEALCTLRACHCGLCFWWRTGDVSEEWRPREASRMAEPSAGRVWP